MHRSVLHVARLGVRLCLIGLLLLSGAFAHRAEAGGEAARKPDRKLAAKNHYESGIHKFDLGKYDEAADEFVAAYEIVGEAAILYNIAQSYRLGERFEKSAQFYRSFLRQMGDAANRPEIEGRIIEMDERAADQRRLAERRAAEKRLAERKDEKKTSIPYVAPTARPTAGGEASSERVEDSGPRPGRTLKIVGYALCGFAVAALGTGIAMNVLTKQASDKVERAASASEVFTPELRDTESRGKLYDTLAIVGYSVAGAAAIGGAVSIYFGFRAERFAAYESETPVSERFRLRPRHLRANLLPSFLPSFSPNGAGFALAGRF